MQNSMGVKDVFQFGLVTLVAVWAVQVEVLVPALDLAEDTGLVLQFGS